jgi:hypothetical protein
MSKRRVFYFAVAVAAWVAAYVVGKSAPEMIFLPGVVRTYFGNTFTEKAPALDEGTHGKSTFDPALFDRIRIDARQASVTVHGGEDENGKAEIRLDGQNIFSDPKGRVLDVSVIRNPMNRALRTPAFEVLLPKSRFHGEISIQTSTGNIVIDQIEAGKFHLEAVSGDISVKVGPDTGYFFSVDTRSGQVRGDPVFLQNSDGLKTTKKGDQALKIEVVTVSGESRFEIKQ